MKRFYIAWLVLLLTLTLAVFSGSYVRNTASAMQRQLAEIDAQVQTDKMDRAIHLTEHMQNYWNTRQRILLCFQQRSQVDEITETAAAFLAFLKNENRDEMQAEYGRLERMLENMERSEKLCIDSIL